MHSVFTTSNPHFGEVLTLLKSQPFWIGLRKAKRSVGLADKILFLRILVAPNLTSFGGVLLELKEGVTAHP